MKLPIYSDGSHSREQIGFGNREEALRIARRMMPADLKRAGFVAGVFESDPEFHGAHYFRIGFGK